MKQLAVVIPFLNENIEVLNTVKGIRDTAKDNVDIVLINDNSTDTYEYEKVSNDYECIYIIKKDKE